MRDLFTLDPAVTFLNHGSYGACPSEVIADQRRWQDAMERQPVAFLNIPHLATLHRRTRAALAPELGADPDDIVYAVNSTQALNLAARSLALKPGDEILTTDHEYAALSKTWAALCADTGAVVRQVTVPVPLTRESAFTDTILAAMTDRTAVLFLSHITSPTALVFPIARVVAEARRRGIVSVIDGAHAPGQIALNLDALGADVYAGNCHKWLMAPKGAAFLHVRRDLQRAMRALTVSHGWTADSVEPGPFGNPAFVDRLEVQGTRDATAWFAVPAALAFRAAHEWPAVIERCRALAARTAARVARLSGLPPISAEAFRAPQMASMPVPDCDTVALHDRLLGEFGIEIPVIRWQDRCFVRISVQGYVTESDCDRLVAALAAVFGWPEAAASA